MGGVLFGVLFYVALIVWADIGEVTNTLSTLPWWIIPAVLGLSLLNYSIRFLKWQRYLALLEIRVDVWTSYLIFLSGMSMSVTPGKMGEVLKSWLLRQVKGTPIHESAPIVLAERFTDLLGYLMLVAIGGLATEPEYKWAFVAVFAGCAVLIALAGSPRCSRIAYRVLSNTPYLWRLAPKVEGSFASMRVLLQPKELLLPTILSFFGWGLECVGFWYIASALTEGGLPFLFCVFVYSSAAVLGAVAIVVPGGLGVTEGYLGRELRAEFQKVIQVPGMTSDAAHALARSKAAGAVILVRLCTLWFAVIVGLLATALFSKRYGDVVEVDEPQAGAASA